MNKSSLPAALPLVAMPSERRRPGPVTSPRLQERVTDVAAEAQLRLEYVDLARGLFVVWMIVAHSLTLARIPAGHWLQWLRPAGWATVCFVMLTGFSLAVLFVDRPMSAGHRWRRFGRRAAELAIVAYASNLGSELIVAQLSGQASFVRCWQVMSFRVPWTISGILVPTAVVVLLAPLLVSLARRVRPVALLLIVSAAGVALGFHSDSGPDTAPLLARVVYARGPFPVETGFFVLLAVWSFSLGNVVTRIPGRLPNWLWPASAFVAVLFWLAPGPSFGTHNPFVVAAARFVTAMVCVRAIETARAEARLSGLILLGRAALLAFVLHRPLVHLIDWAFSPLLGREASAVTMASAAAGICLAAAVLKSRHAGIARSLRRIGM